MPADRRFRQDKNAKINKHLVIASGSCVSAGTEK
jgi:hypothetical protein